MNKANFKDLFNTIGIILLFLIIIGLIFVATYPNKLKSYFFGNKIREGNANINADCYRCIIIPGPVGKLYNIIDISNDITRKTGLDSVNVIPTDVDAYNLYTGTDVSYVFYPWQTPNNNPFISNWANECSSNNLRDIDDNSCCLINDVSHSDFYNENYLLDILTNIKYHGLVFKFESAITTISNETGTTLYNETYKFIQETSGNRYINDRFILYTNNLTPQSVFQQDSNQFIDKVITCSGEVVTLPKSQAITMASCLFTDNANNILGEKVATQLALDNQNCWKIYSSYGEASFNYYCDNSYVSNIDCSAWLPKPSMTTDINNLINQNGSLGGSSSTSPNLSGLLSQEIQSQLQTVTDNLVKQFTNKINSLTSTTSSIEYPNIGNPTYLNIGTCNNNSPYVYNSSCLDSSNTLAGDFQYQYQCYPSLTGQFQDCGPLGYQSTPEF